MSILDSTDIGIKGSLKNIKSWLDKMSIGGYELIRIPDKPFWKINVRNNDVILVGYKDKALPDYIVFDEIVGGNFICSYSEFSSMRGFPKNVGGNFDISFSKISTLDNAPKLIDRDFVATGISFNEYDIRQICRVTRNVYC